MILYSAKSEFKCIRTLTSENVKSKIKNYLFTRLDVSHFHYPPCRAAYKRINLFLKRKLDFIDFEELTEDPAIEEDYRESLLNSDASVCKTKKTADNLLDVLIKYRKARLLYQASKNIISQFESDKLPDVDLLLDETANKINVAREMFEVSQKIYNLGQDSNINELYEKVVYGKDIPLYKTGFSKFDRLSGGLPKEGVFIMAATTSGGKTALARQLMRNMYLLNKINVCALSLEMSEEQELQRTLCALGKVNFSKFRQRKLDAKDRRKIKRARENFEKHGKENNCKYSFLTPTRGMTIDQALLMLKPYDYRVIVIDYISLLEGVGDSREQWKFLSEVARQCKIFSREMRCLVVILAQLDDESDKVRYSKGIIENADNYWFWNYSNPKDRESKILPIKQGKARDQELFNFGLKENFEYMTITDVDEDELDASNGDEDQEDSFDENSGVS